NNILVDNKEIHSAVLSKMNVDVSMLKNTINNLSSFIEIDKQELLGKIDELKHKTFETITIAADIPKEMLFELKEHKPYLPGLKLISEPVRRYRLGYASAHVLGYLGEIDLDELNHLSSEGYKIGDLIGQRGIEKVYDTYLRGHDGSTKMEVDAKGRQLRIISDVPPLRGNDAYVSIDYNLQKKAEQLLNGKKGSIVALKPDTGEVLAMVSSPGFDPTQFLYPLKDEKQKILQDESHPLMNRAIQAQYAPGSIFKIITTIAVLEENKIEPDVEYYCRGYAVFGRERRVFRCWKEKGHKKIAMLDAFIHSCDVYYYNMGLKAGNELLAKYAKMFGLGAYTGLDMPSEKIGFIPVKKWKKNKFGISWYEGDTVNMSIGQGFLLVTPIQLANLLNTIANGGYLYRPFIIKKIVSKDGKELFENSPLMLKHIKISKNTLEFIKKGLIGVVEKGTGRACYIKGIQIAGKTGTTENPHGEDHAWFAAFAPADRPEISLCVLIEHGGHGGAVAAPIAREMFKEYFK
ncbi:penicillin-binding protein 2, partial [bacterium]